MQNPLSRMNTLPLPQTGSVNLTNVPTVFPRSSNCLLLSCGGPRDQMMLKEPDYIMMFMTTYGTLGEVRNVKKRHCLENSVKRVKTFQYPEVVHNHYKYCDVIDNHNSFRMHPISMEETWMTMWWPNRVFCFLLAITMVNVQNEATYFLNKPKIDSLQSRRLIAEALINNEYLQSGVSPRSGHKCHSVDHVLLTVPHFKKFVKG